MKLVNLKEMTMKAGSVEPKAKIFFKTYLDAGLFETAEHIADIDQFEVLKTTYVGVYLIRTKTKIPTGYFFIKQETYGIQLEIIYVETEFRSFNLLAKVCWFLKRLKSVNKMFLGNVHSEITVQIVKKFISNKKFKVKWYDTKTKEYLDYDEEKYSNMAPNNFIICLENEWDHSDFPLFEQSAFNFKLTHCYDLVS